MEVARNRVEGYRGAAGRDVDRYKGHAKRYGMDPAAVAYDLPDTPAWTPPKAPTVTGAPPPGSDAERQKAIEILRKRGVL